MNEDSIKVSGGRIYSLAVHPSESSLIIVAGDIKGNISEVNFNYFFFFNFKI